MPPKKANRPRKKGAGRSTDSSYQSASTQSSSSTQQATTQSSNAQNIAQQSSSTPTGDAQHATQQNQLPPSDIRHFFGRPTSSSALTTFSTAATASSSAVITSSGQSGALGLVATTVSKVPNSISLKRKLPLSGATSQASSSKRAKTITSIVTSRLRTLQITVAGKSIGRPQNRPYGGPLDNDSDPSEATPLMTAIHGGRDTKLFEQLVEFSETIDWESLLRLRHEIGSRRQVIQNAKIKKQNQEAAKDSKSSKTFNGLDLSMRPLSDIDEIFNDMAGNAESMDFLHAIEQFTTSNPLRLVTMCSGTESPVLALQLLNKALQRRKKKPLSFEHLASAEIEPFKQAYIQRNFAPPVIFRDVTEFIENKEEAHTAYGALAKQPDNVHILVAGSSCVDYSNLNNKPKDFGEKGESYSTMRGIETYAKRKQPNIIIIENVRGAPWSEIIQFWENAGYYGVVAYLDSKNFYIPQTRERGYMVAFNKDQAELSYFDVEQAGKMWLDIMQKFQRRASAPYTEFIFDNSSREVHAARKLLSSYSFQKSNRSQDWAACRIRYNAFRKKERLGPQRAMTLWRNNGRCTFPDYGWISWARIQRERIWDTLDIAFLRNVALRDIDMAFKNRWLELSQNVDRDLDTRQWGIIGCLTPSGMPFDTLRGGPVLGREALALQGIPVRDLVLTKESSRQLQDLAGNAMTSTVVGAAIFSAILAGSGTSNNGWAQRQPSMFSTWKRVPDSVESAVNERAAAHSSSSLLEELKGGSLVPLEIGVQPFGSSGGGDLSDILKQAVKSRALCGCQGLPEVTSGTFLVCSSCGATVCEHCGGNPKHRYQKVLLSGSDDDSSPKSFITQLTESLPRSMEWCGVNTIPELLLFDDTEVNNAFSICLKKALSEPCHFQRVERGTAWMAVFESSYARLEFAIRFAPVFGINDPKELFNNDLASAEWLFFVKPEKNEPFGGELRRCLSFPVMRMTPEGSLLSGIWQLRSPARTTSLTLRGNGMEVPAWPARLGLRHDEFKTAKVYSKMDVVVSGDYAEQDDPLNLISGSYTLLEDCGTACGSLHRRAATHGSESPVFLFIDPEPLTDNSRDSFVFALDHGRVCKPHSRSILARIEEGWRPSVVKADANMEFHVSCQVFGNWLDMATVNLSPSWAESQVKVFHHMFDAHYSLSGLSCDGTSDMRMCIQLPLSMKQKEAWPVNEVTIVDIMEGNCALEELTWVLHRAGARMTTGWMAINGGVLNHDCEGCSPTPPKLTWQWTRKPRSSQMIVKPFEDVQQAIAYERALHRQPRLITATIHNFPTEAYLDVKVNVLTAVHQILPKLTPNLPETHPETSVIWRVQASDPLRDFPLFKTIPLKSNDDDVESNPDPRQFTRSLWPTQKRILTWMKKQENETPKWTEAEFYATIVPALNWQVELKASKNCEIAGGIIADEVGAGKTTTSLALIASELREKKSSAKSIDRRIGTSATLILVPANILPQWRSEINRCFKSTSRVVVIDTIAALQKVTVEQVKNATIVLSNWNLFDNDNYWFHFRRMVCAPNVPTSAGRAFEQWLDEALGDLIDLSSVSEGCTDREAFVAERENKKQIAIGKYGVFTGFRTRKSAKKVAATTSNAAASSSNTHATASVDVDALTAADMLAEDDQIDLNEDDDNNEEEADENNEDEDDQNAPNKGKRKSNLKGKKNETKERDPGKNELKQKIAKDLCAGDIEQQEAHPNPVELNIDLDHQFEEDMAFWEKECKQKIYPVFHLFNFRRIIVDEFTYMQGHSMLSVLKLKSQSRWMLSGTPPISNYDGVNTMAKLLGTKVSQEGSCNTFLASAGRSIQTADDTTYAEEFHEYEKIPSPALIEMRHEKAYEFIDHFVRKNNSKKVEAKLEQHLIVVSPYAVELAVYLELYKYLTTQSFKFGSTRPAKFLDEAALELRPLLAIETASGPEAALICSSSNINWLNGGGRRTKNLLRPRVEKNIDCYHFFEKKVEAIKVIRGQLFQELQDAFAYENMQPDESFADNDHFSNLLLAIIDHDYDDAVVETIVADLALKAKDTDVKLTTTKKNQILKAAHEKRVANVKIEVANAQKTYSTYMTKTKAENQDQDIINKRKQAIVDAQKRLSNLENKELNLTDVDSESLPVRKEEMKQRAATINTLIAQLVENTRGARFFSVFADIVADRLDPACPCCGKMQEAQNLYLLSVCGHLVCTDCISQLEEDEGCPHLVCGASAFPHHRLSTDISKSLSFRNTDSSTKGFMELDVGPEAEMPRDFILEEADEEPEIAEVHEEASNTEKAAESASSVELRQAARSKHPDKGKAPASSTTGLIDPPCSRIEAAVTKLEEISEQNENTIVFVQHQDMKFELFVALQLAGIGYVDGTVNARNSVRNFIHQCHHHHLVANPNDIDMNGTTDDYLLCATRQAGDAGKITKADTRKKRTDALKDCKCKKHPVLILQIDSPDAAGWNIQCANHVIFLAPFVAASQYDYDSTLQQAIGRAYRFGQKKDTVHVWQLAIAKTVEINILERRSGKVVVKRDEGFEMVAKEDRQDDEERWEGLSLDL